MLWKKLIFSGILGLLFPYIVTMAWTGRVGEGSQGKTVSSGRKILLDRGDQSTYMELEDYLTGIVARQIPADYGKEALRAQAIIARTYVYRQMGESLEIEESSLDLDYLEEEHLEQQDYKQIREAVTTTAGMVMTYDGEYITPLFHKVSTGSTRQGDEQHPYLQPVRCENDVEAEYYLQVLRWTKEDFAKLVSDSFPEASVSPEQLPLALQMVEKDSSGYVIQFQIGSGIYTGEELQHGLGLASPSFILEEYDGKIRAVCSGVGHGYGLSQYGARSLGKEGWKAEEILSFFYKNIVLISE